jgi:ketosteroid isomerase-like protein
MLHRLEENLMMKRMVLLVFTVCIAIFGLTPSGFTQKTTKAASGAGAIDKAYLQKIWDGWAALDAAGQKQYYAQGQHVFFDIAPLKYGSWDEYQSGSSKLIEEYKAAKFTLNDDLQIHKSGDDYWVTSTVAYDMTHKSGKRDMGNFRWTAILEKQEGKWLIVHEHVSSPLS